MQGANRTSGQYSRGKTKWNRSSGFLFDQRYFPASDAVVVRRPVQGAKADVQVFHPEGDFRNRVDFRNRILVAGCDPGISVLARHVQVAGIDLVLAHRNSSQARKLLKEGCVQHRRDSSA